MADDTLTDEQLDAVRDAARAVRTWPDWGRGARPAVDVDFIRQALNVDKAVRELRAARTRLAAVGRLAANDHIIDAEGDRCELFLTPRQVRAALGVDGD